MPRDLLLLVPLIAGYWFTHSCHLLKFRAARHEGYRLIIESLSWGLALAFLGRVGCFVCANYLPGGETLASCWLDVFPPAKIAYSGTAAATLGLGFVLPLLVNRSVDHAMASLTATERYGDDMRKLFMRALLKREPIVITLESRKVYVGYVRALPNLRPKDAHLVLLTALTGYLDPDDLSLWPNDDSLDAKFEIVIPLETIRAAGIYDDSIWQSDLAEGARNTDSEDPVSG